MWASHWMVKSIYAHNYEALTALLLDGWEPFAVTDKHGDTIWLRKVSPQQRVPRKRKTQRSDPSAPVNPDVPAWL